MSILKRCRFYKSKFKKSIHLTCFVIKCNIYGTNLIGFFLAVFTFRNGETNSVVGHCNHIYITY